VAYESVKPTYSVEDCTSIHFYLLCDICRFCVRQIKVTLKHLLMFFSNVKFAVLLYMFALQEWLGGT